MVTRCKIMVGNGKCLNMEVKTLPEILTLRQACEILNCHPNTLRNWERKGLIECVRFGVRKDRRFPRDAILELLEL